MCLNQLPVLTTCIFCISLRDGVIIISKGGLLLFTPLLIILMTEHEKLGVEDVDAINSKNWLACILVFWIISCILLFIAWAGCFKNMNARDILLQIYLWLVVFTGTFHLVFCSCYLYACYNSCFANALIHLGSLLIFLAVENMCEIFPEVDTCCMIIDLRLAMLLISVFSVMTGSMGLSIVEQRTNANFDNLKNVTNINAPDKVVSGLSTLIPTGLSGMAVVYMIAGVALLFAALTGQEGVAQSFVWLIFINVIVGYVLVLAVACECLLKDACLLSGMDWLSSSAFLVMSVIYLTVWLYYAVVVNSFVVNATS